MKVSYFWEQGGEAKIASFTCDCGKEHTDVKVADNGCGRDELEGIQCECGRYWKAVWTGMEMVEQ